MIHLHQLVTLNMSIGLRIPGGDCGPRLIASVTQEVLDKGFLLRRQDYTACNLCYRLGSNASLYHASILSAELT
jgi:hypothetical protein